MERIYLERDQDVDFGYTEKFYIVDGDVSGSFAIPEPLLNQYKRALNEVTRLENMIKSWEPME